MGNPAVWHRGRGNQLVKQCSTDSSPVPSKLPAIVLPSLRYCIHMYLISFVLLFLFCSIYRLFLFDFNLCSFFCLFLHPLLLLFLMAPHESPANDPQPAKNKAQKEKKRREKKRQRQRQKSQDRHSQCRLDPLLARNCRACKPSGLTETKPLSLLGSFGLIGWQDYQGGVI